MSYEVIKELLDKLSCELVLADPNSPDTLSCLLPILKGIHANCMKLSLKDECQMIQNSRKNIEAMLKDPSNADIDFMELEATLAQLTEALQMSAQSEQQDVQPDEGPTEANEASSEAVDVSDDDEHQMESLLEDLSHLIGVYCPGEFPDLGSLISIFERLSDIAKENDLTALYSGIPGLQRLCGKSDTGKHAQNKTSGRGFGPDEVHSGPYAQKRALCL